MNIVLNIRQSALILGALFLNICFSSGQNSVLELLPGSERLEFDEKTGIHRLYGNVNFKYQSNVMFCDSAHYHQKKNAVYAYGNVHINKRDTLNLFCDSLYYNGKTRMAKLWGNVRVRDNEYKLTTDTLEYDAKKGQASYRYGGTVQSIVSQEKLTSRVGYFHPETKNFFFSKNVVYTSPELNMTTDTLRYLYAQKKTLFYGPTHIKTKENKMYCERGWYNTETEEGSLQKNASIKRPNEYISGDTLNYFARKGNYEGRGNVFFSDSTQQLSFTGDYAFSSDSLHYSFLTGHAIAMKEMESDTLFIHADTLYNYHEDTLNTLKAYQGTRIFSSKFQGITDSLIYESSSDLIELYDEPIMWSNGAELKGDLMKVVLKDSSIQRVEIYDNSSILMEVEKGIYYNQIAGKDITALFTNDELYQAKVFGNAQTISFPIDEKTKDSSLVKTRLGMNRLYSSDLRIDIDSNDIIGISYIEKPDGVFYPMDQLNEDEQFVPGFKWNEAIRPKSKLELIQD